jgi:hypothetical protein
MLRLTLTALALLFVLCAPCAAAPADEAAGEVPFTFEQGYVIVEAKIRGKEPVQVILATGSEFSTIGGEMLEKYKLQSYYTGVPPITGRNDRIITFAKVPDLRVGPAVESLDMRLGVTADYGRALGREIFGVLGYDFLKGRAVQFDFGKRVLRFLDKPAAEALRGKGGAAVFPMTQKEDLFGRMLTLPLVEKVMFNDKPARVMLDTGIVTVVALSSPAAKKLGFETPPEKGATRADSIRSLRIGPVEFSDVPVAIFAKGVGADARLGDSGALVGTTFLQNFVATFDYRGKVVILERL